MTPETQRELLDASKAIYKCIEEMCLILNPGCRQYSLEDVAATERAILDLRLAIEKAERE